MGCVYKLTNIINDKVYIGKTSFDAETRFKEHQRESRKQRSQHKPLYFEMYQYTPQNFIIETLFQSDNEEELCDMEIFFIKQYDANNPDKGYNLTLGGGGRAFLTLSEEEIINFYQNKAQESIATTAKKFNVDNKTIAAILKKNNIHIRTYQEVADSTGKKVAQIDATTNQIINTYISTAKASIALLGNKRGETSIQDVARGKKGSKTAYGYKWKYI